MDGGLHEKEKTDLNPVTRKLYEIDENQTAIDMVSIDKESISNGRPHARPPVEPHLRLLFRSTYGVLNSTFHESAIRPPPTNANSDRKLGLRRMDEGFSGSGSLYYGSWTTSIAMAVLRSAIGRTKR